MTQVLCFEKGSKFLYGSGCVAQVSKGLHNFGVKQALLVTDPGIVAAGITECIVDNLSRANIAHVIFDEIEPNPCLETVELIARVYQEQNCSGIIAVGGGSPIDAAKGAGIMIANDGDLHEFADGKEISGELPPFIAIPTTCGTGSEVTRFAVLTDHDTCQKLMFTSDMLIPDLAILDPELLQSLPSHIVAATGMDALTHAIESILSVFAKPSSDALAVEAIGLITEYLPIAVHADCNSEEGQTARGQMLYASTLAGLAFNDALLGLVHGMSHPLTSYYGVVHGVANACLLPPIMRFNAPACIPALESIAQAMGQSGSTAAIDTIEQLINALNMPSSLRELGVNDEFVSFMVDDAFESTNAQVINPRQPTKAEITDLYNELL